MLNAQLALEALYKDTELFAAEAINSSEAAERALEDLTRRVEALETQLGGAKNADESD